MYTHSSEFVLVFYSRFTRELLFVIFQTSIMKSCSFWSFLRRNDQNSFLKIVVFLNKDQKIWEYNLRHNTLSFIFSVSIHIFDIKLHMNRILIPCQFFRKFTNYYTHTSNYYFRCNSFIRKKQTLYDSQLISDTLEKLITELNNFQSPPYRLSLK